MTTGATTANFTALAAARRWWAQRHGVDVDERGFEGLPSGAGLLERLRASERDQGAGDAGHRPRLRARPRRDAAGRLDVDALERALAGLSGAPAIVIGNAGDVNTGDFDPIERMADLAERFDAWLHIDGAFGLFARLTPRAAGLAAGVERAHSVISDGHKWLNVPYDCGFAFVRDPEPLRATFALTASYLPGDEVPSPESSRRARSLAVWATLRAYGRSGYRAMVERHLDLAQRLARRVDESPELELLADVRLNIVCFRFRPAGLGRGRAGRAERPPGRGPARRRPGLRGHDEDAFDRRGARRRLCRPGDRHTPARSRRPKHDRRPGTGHADVVLELRPCGEATRASRARAG